MSVFGQCPSGADLERFLESVLPDDEVSTIAAHLDSCKACRKRVEEAPHQVAWAKDLRQLSQARQRTTVDVTLPPSRINDLLTDYEVMEEIGRGGMGIVYRARQLKLNRIVALKLLPALLSVVRPDAQKRFRREAELASRLRHAHIVSIHDFGEIDGTFYYSMELIEGRSLQHILAEMSELQDVHKIVDLPSTEPSGETPSRPISRAPSSAMRSTSSASIRRAYYRRVAEWVAEAADALDYAHGRGVIHGDIKPANLLLNTDGRLMITDFGLARDTDAGTMTATRSLLGTSRYMSPEQLSETADRVDHRIDIYALGATMYELLAFRPMFSGTDDGEIFSQVLHADPVPPRRIVRKVPRDLETVCLKAVEKSRDRRYGTAGAMADDLRRWLQGLPIQARGPSAFSRVLRHMRRRKTATLTASVLALLSIFAGILYKRSSDWRTEAVVTRSALRTQGGQLRYLEAQSDLAAGRYAAAIVSIDEALAREPLRPEWEILRAQILRRQDRLDELREYATEILRRDPDRWVMHYLLGELFANEDPAQAREHLARVEELMPDTAAAYYLRALCESDAQQSVRYLDESLALDPRHFESLVERSTKQVSLKHCSAALADADRAITLRPNSAHARMLRGRALTYLTRYEEAAVECRRALELESNVAKWWHNLAWVEVYAKRHAEAIPPANKAIQLDPRYASAYAARGRAKVGLGDIEGGVADCDRSIEIDPTNVKMYKTRAVLHTRLKQWDRAIADFTRAIELRPAAGEMHRNRGIAYRRAGRYAEALADMSRAIELAPRRVGYRHVRAKAYFLAGLFPEAIAGFTDVINRKGENYDAVLRRAMAYEMAERRESALADYQWVIEHGDALSDYGGLLRYLLLRDVGQTEDTTRVATSTIPADAMATAWTLHLSDMLTGTLGREDSLAQADNDKQRTEALYYVARKSLLDGRHDDARRALMKSLSLEQVKVAEYDFSVALLRRLTTEYEATGDAR